MGRQRPEMRNQPDEAQGLAELSVRTQIHVDALPLRRAVDIGREDKLRLAAKKNLLAMAGFTARQAKAVLRSVVEAKDPEPSSEQVWLDEFRSRFDDFLILHQKVQWTDVERSLRADPKAIRKFQALDAKGHKMNVFRERNGKFVFVSGWTDCTEVSEKHRNIVFDQEAQKLLAKSHPDRKCNGNATSIVKALGVDLADQIFHKQLELVASINGWAWLRTDAADRKNGGALFGYNDIHWHDACHYDDNGSFRAMLWVNKV